MVDPGCASANDAPGASRDAPGASGDAPATSLDERGGHNDGDVDDHDGLVDDIYRAGVDHDGRGRCGVRLADGGASWGDGSL